MTMPFSFNIVEQLLLGGMIFFLMLAVGLGLEIKDFKECLRHPRSIMIALLCQYGLMPVLALTLSLFVGIPSAAYLVLLIVASSPGGTSSNIFSFLANANVGLSVGLTLISSVIALVMMPLLITVYGRQYTEINLVIPYGNIIGTLIASMIPIAIGMIVRMKKLDLAIKAEKIAHKIGMIIVFVMIMIWIPKLYNFITVDQVSLFIVIAFLCFSGMTLGLTLSLLTKLGLKDAQTISFETGIQNAPLSFAIIGLSFPSDHPIHPYAWMALVYGALSVGIAMLMLALFRSYNYLKLKS